MLITEKQQGSSAFLKYVLPSWPSLLIKLTLFSRKKEVNSKADDELKNTRLVKQEWWGSKTAKYRSRRKPALSFKASLLDQGLNPSLDFTKWHFLDWKGVYHFNKTNQFAKTTEMHVERDKTAANCFHRKNLRQCGGNLGLDRNCSPVRQRDHALSKNYKDWKTTMWGSSKSDPSFVPARITINPTASGRQGNCTEICR